MQCPALRTPTSWRSETIPLRRDFGGGRPADGALKPQLWVLRLLHCEEGQSYSTLNIDTYSTYPPSLICRLLPYDTVLTLACSLYCSLKLIYRCWSFCEKAYKLRNNRQFPPLIQAESDLHCIALRYFHEHLPTRNTKKNS
jgi:hypothetical protein